LHEVKASAPLKAQLTSPVIQRWLPSECRMHRHVGHELNQELTRRSKQGLTKVQAVLFCSPLLSLLRSKNHWLRNATLTHRSGPSCRVHLEGSKGQNGPRAVLQSSCRKIGMRLYISRQGLFSTTQESWELQYFRLAIRSDRKEGKSSLSGQKN
jgi:hypothetical protein